MRQKKWERLAAFVPVVLLWGTVLLGPTVLVRYVLILWFMVILLPIAGFGEWNESKNQQE